MIFEANVAISERAGHWMNFSIKFISIELKVGKMFYPVSQIHVATTPAADYFNHVIG
jgi:hypothetical protein